MTGKSVTAVIHYVNTTPADWFSKGQATVKTVTYGSESVAAKRATELGVPIMTKVYMLGEKKSVVASSTIPQSILNERHNLLSYHGVREAIATEISELHWCSSDQNRSDTLSKHCKYTKVNGTIRELFDYQGDMTLLKPY